MDGYWNDAEVLEEDLAIAVLTDVLESVEVDLTPDTNGD